MSIEMAMKKELALRPEAVALACFDTRSGLYLGLEVQRESEEPEILAALSNSEPPVASGRWIHASAPIPMQEDLVVVGVAPGHFDVVLLRAWIRAFAERVASHA